MFFVFCLGFSLGALVAWNAWDQPTWITNLVKKAKSAVKDAP